MKHQLLVRKVPYPQDPAKPWYVQHWLDQVFGTGETFATLQEAHTYAMVETRGWSR